MDSYNDYPDRRRPYGRHDDSVPDDIDGPPPPGYLFNNWRPPPSNDPHWAVPTFRGGPEYHTSPPRGYGHYPYSPERGRPREEGGFPQVFRRMDPPSGYPDYGGPPPYGPDYLPDYGPDFVRGSSHGDYGYGYDSRLPVYPPEFDRGPPLQGDFEHGPSHAHGHGFGHGEFDRRPEFDRPPEFERRPLPPEDFELRPPHAPEGYPPAPPEAFQPPPPTRRVQFDTEVHVHQHPDEPRFDASDGRPPLPYEPDQHFHGHEAPPMERVPSPRAPRGPILEEEVSSKAGLTFVPPMPYEPAVGGGASPPPPPPPIMTEPEPVFIPPMPYEPAAVAAGVAVAAATAERRSPHLHDHGDVGDFALDRGVDRAPPFIPPMGMPPPFPDAHYGVATEHGHVKRKHFEGCKDYWAGFLFLLHFWAVVGVCIWLGVKGVIKTNQNNDVLRAYRMAPPPPFLGFLSPSPAPAPAPAAPQELYSIKHWAPQLATAAASGWVFAFIWQWLVRTRTMIKVCLSLGAVSTGLLGIILISTGSAKGLVGLIFLVFALFQGLYVHLVRHRIPFAAIMLGRTRRVVKQYKSLYLISMWTVFLAMFWLAVWIFGVSGAVSLPYGGWYAALLVLSLAWSMEVLRNIVYVTVAGVVGSYYYEGHNMPRLPVLRAYQRAWTISFGSVCLGSMFVAPVQTLHAIAKRLANEQGANEFLFSCVNCFLGVLDFCNKHFNKWAFVEVGLHGKSFVKSAKQTWHMFKDQGAMLLINDDLTGAILLTSCIIGGVLTALVGGCWTFATHRYLTVGVSIISFFIGFFVTYLTLVVPESAVASYYVCFAEDPATLEKYDEPLWQYMRDRKLKLDQEVE